MKRGHARHGRPRRTSLKPAKDKNRKLCTRWYQIVLSEGNFVLCSRLFLYRLSYCMDSTILNIPKLFPSLYKANCYELSKNENKNRIRVTLQTGVPFSSFPYLKMQILRFFCFKRFKSMLKSFYPNIMKSNFWDNGKYYDRNECSVVIYPAVCHKCFSAGLCDVYAWKMYNCGCE